MATTKTTSAPSKKESKFTPPKKLATVADQLYEIRQERLAMQREFEPKIAELKKRERILEDLLVAKLPKDDATGVAGSVARATIEVDSVPIIIDEKKLKAYIQKTGDDDLLQKPKLSVAAVRLRWDAKKTIPGVGVFNNIKVHLNKVK